MSPEEVRAPGAPLRLRVAVALAATLIPLSSTMLAVAVPAIAKDLALDATTITPWIVTSYLIVSILGQGPGGAVGDALGTRRALALGQALCAAGALLGTAATSLPLLVAARMLMAAGGAVMVPAAMAMVRGMTRPDQRVRAFGWFGSLMGLAAAVGPLIGGELTALFGWRATFGSQLIPIVASLLVGRGLWALVPAAPARDAREAGGWANARELLGSRELVGGGLAIALQNTAMYSVLFLMPLLLTGLRGESASGVGRALLAMTASMIAGSILGGQAAARVGARAVAVGASVLAVAGLALLHDVASILRVHDALPGLAVLGLGVGLMNGPANGSAMSSIRARLSGTAAGILSTLRYAGGVLGMLMLAPLEAGAVGAAAEAQMARVITLLAVAAAASGVAGLLLPGRHAPRPATQGHFVEAAGRSMPSEERP